MKSNGLAADVKFPKALSIRCTKRWHQSVSPYRALKVSEDTLKVTMTKPHTIELTQQERNRRLYNRNW